MSKHTPTLISILVDRPPLLRSQHLPWIIIKAPDLRISIAEMERKNKTNVTSMPVPPRRNTSTSTLNERDDPDFVEYELSQEEEAALRAQAFAAAHEAVAEAEQALAAAEEAMRQAEEAEDDAHTLFQNLCLMTANYHRRRMNRAPGATVSKPERKFN